MLDAKQVLSQLQEVVPTSIIYISGFTIMCPDVTNNNHYFTEIFKYIIDKVTIAIFKRRAVYCH